MLIPRSSHRSAGLPLSCGKCWSLDPMGMLVPHPPRGASHPSPGRVGCWEAANGCPLSKPQAQPCVQPAWNVPRSVFLSFQQPRCVPVSLSVVCLCLVCDTGDTPCLNHVSVMSISHSPPHSLLSMPPIPTPPRVVPVSKPLPCPPFHACLLLSAPGALRRELLPLCSLWSSHCVFVSSLGEASPWTFLRRMG